MSDIMKPLANYLNIITHNQVYRRDNDNFYKAYENFTNEHKITPKEANALRHIGASMYFAEKYGADTARALGNLNELISLSSGSAIGDEETDQDNNHIGRLYSGKYDNSTYEKAINNAMDLITKTQLYK